MDFHSTYDFRIIKTFAEHKSKYPKLICIKHEFDRVKDNGLPTAEYNESLIDFDGEVVNLFDPNKSGIIILVETYGGARNYWFYITDPNSYLIRLRN